MGQHRKILSGILLTLPLLGLKHHYKNATVTNSNLFIIKQKSAECVKVAAVVTEETSRGQGDGHVVASLQVEGHSSRRTVFLVQVVFLAGPSHHLAIDLQPGAGSQFASRSSGVTVDGEGQAVEASVGDGEDAVR